VLVAADLAPVALHSQHDLLQADSGRRVSISGRMLIQTQGATRTEQQLETDEALLAAYRDHFGIELSRVPDDPAALRPA
jgi:hypothetical protein